MIQLQTLLAQAKKLDANDPLALWTTYFPNFTGIACDGRGNSLGRQPKGFLRALQHEAEVWKRYGHDGHFEGDIPWWIYHEWFERHLAKLLGCNGRIPEAVIGNTLSTNNFLLLVEFMALARRSRGKSGTLSLTSFFNSDTESLKKATFVTYNHDIRYHERDYLFLVNPDQGDLYSTEYIEKKILEHNVGLVFLPIICHKTGQRFDVKRLATFCKQKSIFFGLDLAHGIGNIPLSLSKWGVDFATFCSYKYLNGGPGAVGGFYVHKDNHDSIRQAPGWWGLDKKTRFGNPENFKLAKGARRLLSSNDQIFNSIGLKVYLEHLEHHFGNDLRPLFQKHKDISAYTYELLSSIEGITVITPKNWKERGCQISFRIPGRNIHSVLRFLQANGSFIEDRGDVLRTAFVNYSRYEEPALLAKNLCDYLAL